MPENKNQKQWLDELSAWSYWDPTDLSQWMYKQLFSPENQGQSIPILLSIAKNADRTVSESIQKKANKLLNHLYNLGTMPKSRFETDADYRQRRQAIQSDMLTRMETDNIFINERKKPPLNGWLDIFPGRLLSAAFGSVLMSVNGGLCGMEYARQRTHGHIGGVVLELIGGIIGVVAGAIYGAVRGLFSGLNQTMFDSTALRQRVGIEKKMFANPSAPAGTSTTAVAMELGNVTEFKPTADPQPKSILSATTPRAAEPPKEESSKASSDEPPPPTTPASHP